MCILDECAASFMIRPDNTADHSNYTRNDFNSRKKKFKVWKLTSDGIYFMNECPKKNGCEYNISVSTTEKFAIMVVVWSKFLFADFMHVTYLCVRCPFHFNVVGLRLSHAWWNGKTHIFLSGSLAIDHMPMSTTIWQLWMKHAQANTRERKKSAFQQTGELCCSTTCRLFVQSFGVIRFVCVPKIVFKIENTT